MTFRLFKAPLEQASDVEPQGRCVLCEQHPTPVALLGIGADVIVACKACGARNPLDADDRKDAPCRTCQATVVFPALPEAIFVCFACLSDERAGITKDTEIGMVRWEDAERGWTDGLPREAVQNPSWETSQPSDASWCEVRISGAAFKELVASPDFSSIQGGVWLCCCQAPMAYVGTWGPDDFNREAHDGDGRRLFEQIVSGPLDEVWNNEMHDEVGIYIFSCVQCDTRRGYWDMA